MRPPAVPQPREVMLELWGRALSVAGAGGPPPVFRAQGAHLRRNVMGLSFDDGPSAANTEDVLDLLRHSRARATFFVVGSSVAGNEHLLERIVAEGHELGNHSFHHTHTARMNRRQLRADLRRANDAIEAVVGSAPRLVRSPFGKDRWRTAAEGARLGMRLVLWSLDSRDTMYAPREEIVRTVLDGARRGEIALFHDGGNRRPETLCALGDVLPELARRGFALVSVGELLDEAKEGSASLSSLRR